jgi:dephospho-CoA kinase
MKKIGVTGGIGSGKSVVCEVFRTLGCKIYNADDRAKMLLDNNSEIRKQITSYFGTEIYESGIANRKLLASKVFNNPAALNTLNGIIHPAVFDDFQQWTSLYKDQPYIIKEAAIMFESGANKQLDSVILVYASPEIRMQRVMHRDNISEDAVGARMNNQMSDDDKLKLSDYVIYNDGVHSLIKQVLTLHNSFIK